MNTQMKEYLLSFAFCGKLCPNRIYLDCVNATLPSVLFNRVRHVSNLQYRNKIIPYLCKTAHIGKKLTFTNGSEVSLNAIN